MEQIIKYQDGVAPQAPIKGIGQRRAYIPTDGTVVRNWLMSHSIGNYKWIFEKLEPSQNGFVKPRK